MMTLSSPNSAGTGCTCCYPRYCEYCYGTEYFWYSGDDNGYDPEMGFYGGGTTLYDTMYDNNGVLVTSISGYSRTFANPYSGPTTICIGPGDWRWYDNEGDMSITIGGITTAIGRWNDFFYRGTIAGGEQVTLTVVYSGGARANAKFCFTEIAP